MKTVQLAIRDSEYAQSLRNLLVRDGSHKVYLVDRPDRDLDGVIVVDEARFSDQAVSHSDPERFVVITRKGANLARVWDAGIRHVVFEGDSPSTAQLAVIAAELRLPRAPATLGRVPVSHAGRHLTPVAPTLPILDSPAHRCHCGLRNACPDEVTRNIQC
jgi:hypothetical protein